MKGEVKDSEPRQHWTILTSVVPRKEQIQAMVVLSWQLWWGTQDSLLAKGEVSIICTAPYYHSAQKREKGQTQKAVRASGDDIRGVFEGEMKECSRDTLQFHNSQITS